jgi:phenylacetaldehyde dehydrogenase
MSVSVVAHPRAASRPDFVGRTQKLLIGGEWTDAASGATFEVIDPATGESLGLVAEGGAEDIDRAVRAARKALTRGAWAEMPAAARGVLLHRLADIVAANVQELATIESLDGGNPLASIQHVDVGIALGSLRSIAGWADKVMGDVPMTAATAAGISYVVREPVGVVGAITPWNAPLLMAIHKIAPALAMGCTVVLKPAELTPLSALRLGEMIVEAGFPAGVVNIVTGYGHTAGQALVDHPDVNKISFTGSTRVGRSILAAAGGSMKRVTLELGGKSPIIVLADADIPRAAAAIAKEICFKTGQYCAAGTRLFVEAGVHDRLVEAIGVEMKAVTIGHGIAPGTQMGPIISQVQLDRVMGYIADAAEAGASIATGGGRVDRTGFFVEPTLLTGVTADMAVFREEIFGPVLSVIRIEDAHDLDAIAAMANDSDYGLAAKIWTGNIAAAHGLARRIQAGSIVVNGGGPGGRLPFGGFKQSGIGREGGLEGMLAYTEVKSVSIGF